MTDIPKLPIQSLLAVAKTYADCFEARGMTNAADVMREMRRRLAILEGLATIEAEDGEGTVRKW